MVSKPVGDTLPDAFRGRGNMSIKSEPNNNHIMLRCPHCDQLYEAVIGNNELVRDGLTITPLPIEIPIESEIEQ